MHDGKDGDEILLGVSAVVKHVWKAANYITPNSWFLNDAPKCWRGNNRRNRCLNGGDKPLCYNR